MYLQTGSKKYDLLKETLIMGILNITPDSFSDGGSYISIEAAVHKAVEMERDGAHIIDIGGESTRPDHTPITTEEEIARVVPVIKAVKEAVSIPISIDTFKAQTAQAAIQAGAEIINDVWGAKKDPEIAKVAANFNVPIILMHNRDNMDYRSLMDDMVTDLEGSIKIAKEAGVKDEQIVLDPGIGFAKEIKDNYLVMRHLDKLVEALPYPFLLGASRKRFINEVIEIPAHERDNATGATTCFGIAQGVHMVRVHEVKKTKELVMMMDAMTKGVGLNG